MEGRREGRRESGREEEREREEAFPHEGVPLTGSSPLWYSGVLGFFERHMQPSDNLLFSLKPARRVSFTENKPSLRQCFTSQPLAHLSDAVTTATSSHNGNHSLSECRKLRANAPWRTDPNTRSTPCQLQQSPQLNEVTGKYLTTGSPGGKEPLVRSICQLLWCKYTHNCYFQ